MWFSSFWNTFGYLNNNKINDLVRDNASIEEFLDEENILSDVKQASTKFAKHLVKNPEKLKKLIDYCIQEQDLVQTDGSDMGKCVKYPFLSSEIFQTQPPKIAEFLLGEYELSEDEEEQDKEKSDSRENNSYKDDLEDEEEKDVEDQVKEEEEEKKNTPSDDKKEEESSEKKEEEIEEEQKKDAPTEEKKEENNDVEEPKKEEKNQENEEEQKKEEDKKEEPSITGPEILSHLFSFLEKDEKCEHFSTSAGYFSKIVTLLLRKQSSMWNYFVENPQVQQNFLKHIDDRSIGDLVLQMINNTSATTNYWSTEESTPDQFVENKKKLIEELLKLFEKSEDQETLENISFILSEVYNNYIQQGESSSQTNTDLALPITGNSCKILFQKLKSTDSYIVFCTASILNNIFQLEVINEESRALKNASEDQPDAQAEEVKTEVIISRGEMVEYLLEALQNEPKIETHQTQYGAQQKPFGLGRMKILEIFTSIIKLNNKEFNEAIQKSQFYALLIQYFKENEWNNLLHCTVEKIFQNTLENNTDLLATLLEQTEIAKTIIAGSALNDKSKPVEEQPNKGQPGEFQNYISRGNVGFLTKFANMFIEKMEEIISVEEYFNKVTEWKDFVENSLKDTNELEKERELGGSASHAKEPAETSIDIIKIYEKLNQYFTKPQPPASGNNYGDDDEVDDVFEKDDNEDRNVVMPANDRILVNSVKEVPLQAQQNNWIQEEMATLNQYDTSQYWKNVPKYEDDDIDKLLNE